MQRRQFHADERRAAIEEPLPPGTICARNLPASGVILPPALARLRAEPGFHTRRWCQEPGFSGSRLQPVDLVQNVGLAVRVQSRDAQAEHGGKILDDRTWN